MDQTVRVDCDACGTPYSIELRDVVDLGSEPLLRGRLMRRTLNFALCPHCGDGLLTDHPFVVLDPVAGRSILFVPADGANAAMDSAILRNLLSIYQTEESRSCLKRQVQAGEWSQLVTLLAEDGAK